MKIRRVNNLAAAAAAVLLLMAAREDYASQAPATGTNAAPTQILAPTEISLPLVPAKVLQLSEAGISDALIISYIQKSANPYTLTADQVIYLHDLGVSAGVLQALVENEGTGGSAPTPEALGGTASPPDATSSTPGPPPPPVGGAAVNFYDALAPYGTWVDVPAYGWCWQPTTAEVNPAWQPYCDNGSWLWTDQGWYWNSGYSWGWAPFHYGRWCQYPGYGWLWCPDNTWGPAWVCWRDYPGYCGWAPLPPGACFTVGGGWTFNGLAVGFNYGFGLGPRCFTFCDYDDFCGRHPFEHFRHGHDADRFFDHSRVNNDVAWDAHHHFVNRGIDPSRIEAATHSRIGQVSVREFPHRSDHRDHFAAPDRLVQDGKSRVIYRPDHDLSVMRNHFQPGAAAARSWAGESTAQRFTAERTVGNVHQYQPARPNTWQSPAPAVTWNRPDAGMFNHNQNWSRVEPPQAIHSPPAQGYRRDVSNFRSSTPAWHPAPAAPPMQTWRPAPAWHPAPAPNSPPAWHAAPVQRSAPAWHAAPVQRSAPVWNSSPARSGGGEIHFGGGTPSIPGGGAQSRGGWHR